MFGPALWVAGDRARIAAQVRKTAGTVDWPGLGTGSGETGAGRVRNTPLISHLLSGIRRKRIWEVLEDLEAWEAEGRTLLQELQSRSIPESAMAAECKRLIELLDA